MEKFTSYIVPVGVVLTFIGTLISIHISRKNSKSTKYIDTITSERIKWIEKIRTEVADINSIFITIIKNYQLIISLEEKYDVRDIGQSAYILRETSRLKAEIDNFSKTEILKKVTIVKLRLNPIEDEAIINCLSELIEFLLFDEKTGQDTVFAWDKNASLIDLTQQMLKAEWEKVKIEAKS